MIFRAGRMVHFYAAVPGDPRAAVLNMDTDNVGMAPQLTVFEGRGPSVLLNILFSEEPTAGRYTLAPYEEALGRTARRRLDERTR